VCDFMLRKSAVCRQIFYTGSNEKAAAYSGIKTDRVKIAVMMISGFLCGIGGVIYMVRFSGVPVSAGEGFEMTAIASCVIGGVSMNGGRGTVLGAVLGLTFMTLITNAMNLFLVSPTVQELIRYLIVLAAVILDNAQANARAKKLA
ncbi:MAG: ABC transporter permease, partial [Firmicutes bacterium]|nr:ABC transporter permease [Bacillota bacterium]